MQEVRTLQNARLPQKTRQLSLAPRSPEAERIADLPCNADATGIQISPRKCSRPIPRIRGTKRGKNLALNQHARACTSPEAAVSELPLGNLQRKPEPYALPEDDNSTGGDD